MPKSYNENKCSNVTLDENKDLPCCDINGNGISGETVQLTTMENEKSGFIKRLLLQADALNLETGEYDKYVPIELMREGDPPECNAFERSNSTTATVDDTGDDFKNQSDFMDQHVQYLSADKCNE